MSEAEKISVDVEKDSINAQLKKYVVTNPITVVTATGSFLGGLLILTYLVSIRYFPSDISASTVGFLLAGAAIVGTVLTFLLAIYLVFPGAIYRYVLNEASEPGKQPADVNCPRLLSGRAIFWLLDIPSLLVCYTAIFAAFFQLSGLNMTILIVTTCAVVLLLLYGKYYKKEKRKRVCWHIMTMFTRVWRYKAKFASFAFASGISAFLPWFIVVLLMAQYERETSDGDIVWGMFVLSCLIAIGANHLIAGAKKLWFLAGAAPVLLLLFITITQQYSLIPKMVVRALAFGNIPKVTLFLDEQGCQIANQHLELAGNSIAKNSFTPTTKKENKKDKEKEEQGALRCWLSPVNLKWRIGNEYFVDATGAQLYFPAHDKSSENTKKDIGGKRTLSSKLEKVVVESKTSATVQLPPLLTSGFSILSTHVLSWSITEQKTVASQ